MTYCPDKHHRHSIRLSGYDYTQNGAYFVTICSHNRECLLGQIKNNAMHLNDAGRTAFDVWRHLPDHYFHVQLDQFVVMPNHIHGIVVLNRDVGAGFVRAGFVRAGLKPAPTDGSTKYHALPEIIRGFKTFSSRRINEMHQTSGEPVWQRNYFEHVIRNENELDRIRRYIADNPARWAMDRENPDAVVGARRAVPRLHLTNKKGGRPHGNSDNRQSLCTEPVVPHSRIRIAARP